MLWSIEVLVNNLGIRFETLLVIFALIGSLLFFARDFKLGVVMLMITNGLLFLWFYNSDWAYGLPLTIFLLSVILLALSFYTVDKTVQAGGVN